MTQEKLSPDTVVDTWTLRRSEMVVSGSPVTLLSLQDQGVEFDRVKRVGTHPLDRVQLKQPGGISSCHPLGQIQPREGWNLLEKKTIFRHVYGGSVRGSHSVPQRLISFALSLGHQLPALASNR